jgi:hypothetical protein
MPTLKVYQLNKETFKPEHVGTQKFYNTDKCESGSEWIKTKTKSQKVEGPLQSSGLLFKEKGRGSSVEGMLGDMYNDNNNVYKNAQSVALYSAGFSSANNQFIFPDNFLRCILLFTARRLIKDNWIIHQAEYLAPVPSHQLTRFCADSLVYALFEIKNNMTAVRDVEHKGKLYRIKNNLFWRKRAFMRDLANKHQFHEMFNDLRNEAEESYIRQEDSIGLSPLWYSEGATIHWKVNVDDPKISDTLEDGESCLVSVSEIAQKVLDMADSLLVDSMEMRRAFHVANPEYNLHAWDAGYYQLKYLWRELYPERYAEFRSAYKELEEHLRPQVYELGMLLD